MSSRYDNLLANVPTDLWIGGKWRKSSDGGRFDVLDPATENKIASVASATVDDAKAAVDAASDAFPGWAARGCRLRGLGWQEAARTRGDFAQVLRADHARCRAARQADHHRERQGAPGFARRGGLCGRILSLVRGGGGAQCRRGLPRSGFGCPHRRASQAGRRCSPGDPVEFPGGYGHPEDRACPRSRLHGRAQAGFRYAAHHACLDADPGGGGGSGGCGERHPLAFVGTGGERDASRSARARRFVHRLDRGRPQAAARGGGRRRQTGDGARRQRAVHHIRGRRYRRGHRRGNGRQDAKHGRGLHVGQPVLRARKGA